MRSPLVYFSAGQNTLLRLEKAIFFSTAAFGGGGGGSWRAVASTCTRSRTTLPFASFSLEPSSPLPSSGETLDTTLVEAAHPCRSHSCGRLSVLSRRNPECRSKPSGVTSRWRTSHACTASLLTAAFVCARCARGRWSVLVV